MKKNYYSKAIKDIIQQLELNNKLYLKAYNQTLQFFHIYDILKETNHRQLFQSIFGRGKKYPHSLVYLSIEYYCSLSTLYRYIANYITCFYCCLAMLFDE